MSGVEAVYTSADVPERFNIAGLADVAEHEIPPHPFLARGVVHAVGVPVAAVVAQTAPSPRTPPRQSTSNTTRFPPSPTRKQPSSPAPSWSTTSSRAMSASPQSARGAT